MKKLYWFISIIFILFISIIYHETGWVCVDIQVDSDSTIVFVKYKLFIDEKLFIEDSVHSTKFDAINMIKIRTGIGKSKIRFETKYKEFNFEKQVNVLSNKFYRVYFKTYYKKESHSHEPIREIAFFCDGYRWWYP